MEPLIQWICDLCGKVIEKPEDGYVAWGENEQRQIDRIRILHKNNHVNGHIPGCGHDNFRSPMSQPLESLLGDNGKVYLLSMIDPDPGLCWEFSKRIADMRLFLEFFRRVQLPYYEEARMYWGKARSDSFFDGANEIWTYLPRNLKAVNRNVFC